MLSLGVKGHKVSAGEYGDQLVRGSGQVLAGEERLSVTSEGLVNLLGSILVQPTVHPIAAEYALTALMKLSSRLPDQATRIKVNRPRLQSEQQVASHTARCLCP